MRLSHPAFATLLCGLIVSCLPGGRPPEMAVKRGSTLGARGRGVRTEEGPFRVSFAGPAGSVEVPQPQIVFSKPMRALGQKADDPQLAATFSPPVRGHWEWIGTSAARFVPEGGFAEATAYTMEIAPGLRALDGELLPGPVRLAFSTVPPRLDSHSPQDNEKEVGLHESVRLFFNQIISRPELEGAITIVNRAGQVLPFTVEQDGDYWGNAVQLKPRGAWPDADRITVRMDAGMRGDHGLLRTKAREISFDTVSSLHVKSLECSTRSDGRCDAWSSLSVQLSDEMRPSDFWPLVKITPRVKINHPQENKNEPTSWFSIDAEFKEGETYKVEIIPSSRPPAQRPVKRGEAIEVLRPLKEGTKGEFVFAPHSTGVEFNFHHRFVPFSHDELAAKAEETKKATAGVAVLDRDLVMKLDALTPQRKSERAGEMIWDLAGLKTVALPIRQNLKAPPAWQTLKDLAPDRPGPVLFGARWDGFSGPESIQQVLQRTDLSFHYRNAPDETLVWVTSIHSGMPVEGVSVEARDPEGHSVTGTTDKDGVVTLVTTTLEPAAPKDGRKASQLSRPMVLFAQKGDDWIYQHADRPQPAPPRGTLFTERGLYRPGETVSIKGLVRQPTARGFDVLAGKEVSVAITAPGGHTTTIKQTTSAFGTFQLEFPVGEDASLGIYSMTTSLDERSMGYASFRVKEYRPSSFSVEASMDKPTYTAGETATCRVRGTYLYGGSLLGSKAGVRFTRSPITFQIPGLQDYVTGDWEYEHSDLPDRRLDGKLDATGQISFEFPLTGVNQKGAERVSCEATVTDPGLDMVGSRDSSIVHASDIYVAMENLHWAPIARNQGISPRLLVVTPEGVRRNQSVKLELFEHRRRPTKHDATLPPVVVSSCEVTTKSDPVSCRVIAPSGPQDDVVHYTLRATTKDSKGREITAAVRMQPGSPPPRREPKKPKVKPQRESKIVAEQPEVSRGQVAHFKASSPFEQGEALVTFERDGIMGHRVFATGTDPVDVEFTMDEGTAPFVNALAWYVSPYSDKRSYQRAMQAATKVGTSWHHHRLDVAVRPAKSQATPGEEMDVEVEVHQADGSPAQTEVTLYAADEATLNLANYQLPDPISSFFEHRSFSVSGGTTRTDLGTLLDWKEELRQFGLGSIGTIGHGSGIGMGSGFGSGHGRLGGDHTNGARPSDPARRNFRQTAFFLPSLQTDEKGKVKAHVQLPDSLTTYRVMAFAVSKGIDMGAGQSSIMTSKPLQVRPILPRVIRAGDHFVIAAMAANNGPTKIDAEVSFEATGLVGKGPASKQVSLAPGASQRLTFEVDAPQAGKGLVSLRIQGGDKLTDAAELPIAIESPLVVETSALYGTAEGRVNEQLGDLSAVRPDVGGLDLSLSSSPLAGLGAGLDQLVSYPYGCTEQTTSRLVPLLPLRDLAKALGVALPADIDQATREAVQRLASHQQRDGGFGLWPNSTSSSPWLSVYATWGLTEARRRKVPTDEKVIEQARHYLLGILGHWQGGAEEQRATAPFALDVLAGDTEEANTGGLLIIADQFFREREGLPVFSKALLLHAMGKLGAPRADIDKLTTELTANVHLDGPVARHVGGGPTYELLFDSTVRTSALILRSLVAVAPTHALVKPLAAGLIADRKGGTWRSTQEAAWALLALDDYRRQLGEGATQLDGQAQLGETVLLQRTFEAAPGALAPEAHATIPMTQLLGAAGQDLSFIGQGSSPLYYEARLRFSPRDLPAADISSGFEIHRRHILVPTSLSPAEQQLDGWRLDATRFKEGDLILDEVEVVATSTRRFVVIDDPIPGGFESVDLDLQGGPRWVRPYLRGYATRTERRDDRVLFFLDEMTPGAYRYRHLVRATAAGRFVTPPARVEEMYTPETYGLTAGRVVTID